MRTPRAVEADRIGPDTPLRLNVAASIAYPDGSMTASGLRREAARGRLVIERTAGRDYTTLSNIARMRELCRKPPKVHVSGSAGSGETERVVSPIGPYGSSAMTVDVKKALDAALTIVGGLNKRSPSTSPTNASSKRQQARATRLEFP
jgi:hypothetical protein